MKSKELGKKRKLLVGLSVAILFGVIVFGLNPKDFSFSNGVRWIIEQSGIRFGKYGIAYTDSTFEPFRGDGNTPQSLSVEIALRPDGMKNEGFKFILVL